MRGVSTFLERSQKTDGRNTRQAAAPKAKAVRGQTDAHQRDPDAEAKPRKRSGNVLDESQRGRKRLEVPSEGRHVFVCLFFSETCERPSPRPQAGDFR